MLFLNKSETSMYMYVVCFPLNTPVNFTQSIHTQKLEAKPMPV